MQVDVSGGSFDGSGGMTRGEGGGSMLSGGYLGAAQSTICSHSVSGGDYSLVGVSHPKQRQYHDRGRFRACHQRVDEMLEACARDNRGW